MVMARFDYDKSDEWIREKMVKHVPGDARRRTLIRQKLDNGYEDNGINHTIYYLSGSPIKAYAVHVDTRISFYEQNGKRWAEYDLGLNKIIHDVSTPNTELLRDIAGDDQ